MRTDIKCHSTSLVALIFIVFTLLFEASLFASSIVEFTAIGKIESIYKDRVSLNILHIIASEPEKLNVATGSWVSFDIPRSNQDKDSRRDKNFSYGNVVEVSLIGNVATEYELDENDDGNKKITSLNNSTSNVLMWTAQSCKKVKNPKNYLPKDENSTKKGRKKDKKKKEQEPVKIWTQEETVRGKVLVRQGKVYVKEDRVGKKDKGLEVISEEWSGKLQDFPNQKVVLHGISHRTSAASGTFEIHNVLKVYPK